ncbi:hypothetical protein M9H77_31348 [Catharanthus roseus]|uniref:Uncharacterized protein n=1 Tax=Catharanthus roseus TaxID=4058 RepID=A0ACC0A075_CATRO|nr:hypothetical protein M9H77_31348 [Catharanthus roseus]
MGTEVLRPQDCLGERFRVCPPAFHRRKSSFTYGNGFGYVRTNNSGYRKPLNNRPDQRLDTKRKPTQQQQPDQQQLPSPRRISSSEELQNHLNKSANHQLNLNEMGRVAVLRRGQSLESFETTIKKENNSNKTRGAGGIMKKKLNIDGGFSHGYGYSYDDSLYAGSAFSVSPSPESLPLPSFFNNNSDNNSSYNKRCEYEDSATRDLRRLLRLE